MSNNWKSTELPPQSKKTPLCGVYLIECEANDARYVGSSIDIARRLRAHVCLLRRGCNGSTKLQAAWGKYGEATFRFSILSFADRADLVATEQMFIDKLKPSLNLGPALPNPMTGRKHRPESIALMRAKLAGRPSAMKGKPFPEAAKAALRAARIGKPSPLRGTTLSAETKRKISEAAKLRPPRSDEYRAKLSASIKGVPKTLSDVERERRAEQMRAMNTGKPAWNRGVPTFPGAASPHAKPVLWNGKIYGCIGDAAKGAGVCYGTMRKYLRIGTATYAVAA